VYALERTRSHQLHLGIRLIDLCTLSVGRRVVCLRPSPYSGRRTTGLGSTDNRLNRMWELRGGYCWRAIATSLLVAIATACVAARASGNTSSATVGGGTFDPGFTSVRFAPTQPPMRPDRFAAARAAAPDSGATVTGNWYTGAVDGQGHAVDGWDFEPNAQGVLTGTAILPVAIVGCEVPSGSPTWESFVSQPDGEYFGGVLGYGEETCTPGATPAPGAAIREFTVADGTHTLEISENQSQFATSQTSINADGSVSDTSPFWCFRLGRPSQGPTAVPSHACANANAVSASSYVALGDSVAAGEGIGYGWHWNASNGGWEGGNSSGSWNSTFEPMNCHQTPQGYPHVVATILNAGLMDYACTGSSAFNGVLGEHVEKGSFFGLLGHWTSPAQLGSSIGLHGAEPPNPAYDAAKPDLVSLTLGADDVHFEEQVVSCYTTFCNTDQHSIDGILAEQEKNLTLVVEEIHRRGVADGKVPLLVLTEYYNPFPAYDWNCVDIYGDAFDWISNDDMRFLIKGLERLNHNIATVATRNHLVVLNTDHLLEKHRFCSSQGPWVYGPSIELDNFPHIHSPAPFHPTPEGQQAIGDALAKLVSDKLPVNAGSNVLVSLPHGQLAFSNLATAGEAAIIPEGDIPGSVPSSNTFAMYAGYDVTTSADYSGNITVSLPARSALSLYHYVEDAWQEVPSTFNGSHVSGVVSSLSPFALGQSVSPVHARLAPVTGAEAPASVRFDASGSSVEDGSGIASYEWEFGDEGTATGPAPTHTYMTSGTYKVTVTVTAADGAVDTTSEEVTITHAPPHAVLAGPTSAATGTTLSFDSSGSSASQGSVVGELWEFGDGTEPESGPTASHAYATPGTYQVTLTVRDEEGAADMVTLPVTITASGGSASPSVAPNSGSKPSQGVLSNITRHARTSIGNLLARDRHARIVATLHCSGTGAACIGHIALRIRRHGKLIALGYAKYNVGANRTAKIAVTPIKTLARITRAGSLILNILVVESDGFAVSRNSRLGAATTKRTSHHK
jgi:PKD repeat protein/lysophospholipase L1-like esterase